MAKTILIIDDDPTQRRLLESVVGSKGYRSITAADGQQGINVILDSKPGEIDCVLLDLNMPGVTGMTVLSEIHPKFPALPIIVLTSNGSVTTVIQAMQSGAHDFIVKPGSPERIHVSIQNALKINALSGEVSRLTRRNDNKLQFSDIVGKSLVMRQSVMLAERAAQTNIPILIEGESGVGKEVMARAIQGGSERAGKPFIAVNCGAIPENLVESILFGHEKGSFTGAATKSIGKFQEANGGTLFLDEVGELPLQTQVKLLRAIQEGEVEPVGAKKPVKVNIRLVSATNKNLQKLVAEGRFREDLYYRLNVFPLMLPSLRDRPEDIPQLVEHFIQNFSTSEGKKIQNIEESALDLLCEHNWPGNVRQLENAVYRAVVLCEGDQLTLRDFPQLMNMDYRDTQVDGEGLRGIQSAIDEGDITAYEIDGHLRRLADIEADIIERAIDKYDCRMSEIARRLGIGRSTLYRKVRELGLEVRDIA